MNIDDVLSVHGAELKSRVMLAPMAGVTDSAFRRIFRELGNSGLVFTEMVSTKGLCNNDLASARLAFVTHFERPASIQLFGSDPNVIARSIEMLNDSSADFFDINMGCPMPKITRNGEGSALLLNPKLAEDIMKAASKVSKKPVSAKIRTGWDRSLINAVEFAKTLEDSGAAMIIVHGRTRDQMYCGSADWNIIGEVKRAVKVPVIGNGDVTDIDSAKKMIEQTGCDGVMVGRAARGNPWLFDTPDPRKKPDVIRRHFKYALAFRGEHIGILEMRKHLAWYVKGIRGAAAVKNEIFRLNSAEEILRCIDNLSFTDAVV